MGLDVLAKYASGPTWPARRPARASGLETFYGDCGGGFFWGGALLVRPLVELHDQPMDVAAWNDLELWKGRYGEALRNVTCFAEDAFGGQFGVSALGKVVRFDPETGETTPFADELEGWARRIVNAADVETGFPTLKAWERVNGRLERSFRLVPRQPFFLGGEFVVENLVQKSDVEAMLIRAGLWEVTRDIPDGTRIALEPSN